MKPGEIVPDFTLPDERGEPRSLNGFLESGPVVLFFYPAAMTPGCTAESCHFRDLAKEFAEVGAQRVGISPDPVARQQEFSARHGFDYPLLSDTEGEVARTFGVRRSFGPLLTKRHTFVIDTDGRLLEVIKSELRMSVHADKALEVLRARSR
ncbi:MULTISPECIES: peroxiredoxin [Amycolatopsis]|uniref:thioredoxin-dependent peroxiredoxin n=1 Tax=Amycolatopsis thermalba TaxID=944492 RepID=A0ABY4NZQ4_9PSEU|nr:MULTISPECIES: peroxiredoxin [Amycolatopsis]OXM66274.1 peroxiredoxin [Amycolatopsis sp. KNN50.9b]UQS25487.1 peroxiredoxin [Amycolatopsis thermalba]